MNKIYSLILSLAIIIGLCQTVLAKSASDNFPELLPLNNVDVQKIMNIKPANDVQKATKTELFLISDKNLTSTLDKKTKKKKLKSEEKALKQKQKAQAKAEREKIRQKALNQKARAKKNQETQKALQANKESLAQNKNKNLQVQKKVEEVQKRSKGDDRASAAVAEQDKKTKAAVNKDSKTPEISAVQKRKEKDFVLSKKETKRLEKKKAEYKDYLIQTDGYMPVGNLEDRTTTIVGSVQKTLEFNLADCLELALMNHPRVQSAYAGVTAQRAVKNQTLSNYSPRINLNAGITRMKPDVSANAAMRADSYTKYLLGTIGVSQLVYDFGVTQNQYTIDKLAFENSKINIESVVNDVVCSVKESYYNLLFALARKQVALDTVKQYEEMYKQARAFYQVGTKPKVDVTIAASNLADARANLIEASTGVDIAISKLNNAMGLPFVPPYVVDTAIAYQDVDLSMKQAVEIANNNRPDLKMTLIQMEQANQYVKLAKKTFLPAVEFKGNWSVGGRHDFTDTNWYDAGGYLTFPVINPFLLKNQVTQAKALYEQQRYDTRANVNDIYFEIQQAYAKLADAKERIPAAKLFVKEAKESYELSKGRYRVGVCDAIELRDAQVQFANAKLAYINTLYDYNSAKARLEKAIGKSIAPSGENEKVEI